MDDVKVVAVGGSGTGMIAGQQIEGVTPSGSPNVAVQVIGPIVAILVRNIHLFLIAFAAAATTAGLSHVEGAPVVIPWTDASDLLWKCSYTAGVGTAWGILKDVTTLFGRLEQKFPFLTGNV